MNVSAIMTRNLILVSPEDSVEVAIDLLRRRGIRHLLVAKNNRLVGIVSDRDIKRALDPRKTRKKLLGVGGLFFLMEPILVREIMTPDPMTIGPNLSVQDAATIMVAERFGALPVVRGGEAVGIVTETDLLRYFAQARTDRTKEAGKARQSRPKRKA
jgi:acetoin utilization protein AcuB